MSGWSSLAWIPIRLALLTCAIYLGFVVALCAAVLLAMRISDGFLVGANRVGWILLNAVLFIAASGVAARMFWPVTGPK